VLSVLLVEPHTDTRELYAEFLEFSGYKVWSMDNTDEACRVVSRVDAVVTALHTRGSLDGLGFIAWLRSNPATADMPIIALSASGFPTDAARAVAVGCDLFLVKPCLPGDLAAELRQLARRHARRARMAKVPVDRRRPHHQYHHSA
jgi:two-component system, cell cycle response regulator DivK